MTPPKSDKPRKLTRPGDWGTVEISNRGGGAAVQSRKRIEAYFMRRREVWRAQGVEPIKGDYGPLPNVSREPRIRTPQPVAEWRDLPKFRKSLVKRRSFVENSERDSA